MTRTVAILSMSGEMSVYRFRATDTQYTQAKRTVEQAYLDDLIGAYLFAEEATSLEFSEFMSLMPRDEEEGSRKDWRP